MLSTVASLCTVWGQPHQAIASQEVMASAAFTLSRWGAWSSVRTDYLLSQAKARPNEAKRKPCLVLVEPQALRRDHVAVDRAKEQAELRPYLLEDAELIPASAGRQGTAWHCMIRSSFF